ncbi:GTP cyclohydrolase [Zhouia sp. PK063]|uniref:GTP cyclohydrolase n=1 Tax=Zhouia sp. PK063 TaxID=3373602 RepID=UPI0037A04F06
MITIKEATSQEDMKQFVKFPFQLYKGSPYWVPPIIKDELASFDKNENPVFKHAQAQFFLALKNNKVVGRVAAIINWTEVKEQQLKKMRFGWFDFIDDDEVSEALLNKVAEIGKQHELEYLEGPVGFSNLDKVGVLTDGFDEIGSMITWYNHPYYIKHYETLGFTKEKEYIESKFSFEGVDPALFMKASKIIEKRFQVKALAFTKTKDLMPYVDKMFDLFNETYSKLSSFVAMSEEQKAYFKEKYISFINPEYIKFIVDKDDQMVAFSIVMPSFSKALQKANGKLFPFGVFHLLNARKNSKDAIFYLIGIDPKFQNKGLTAIIFREYYPIFQKRKIENCIRTPELSDNIAIQQIWKPFNPRIFKRRCTLKKDLN